MQTNTPKYINFHLSSECDLDDMWQQLDDVGCQILFSSDDANGILSLTGSLPPSYSMTDMIALFPQIIEITDSSLDIDWESQWRLHGVGYRDGYLHVEVQDNKNGGVNRTLRLQPGPGFGDLSHPTTRIVLQLMAKYIPNKHVLDIGCGSGILSLVAEAMGATSVSGIDIDEEALNHARLNSALNKMEKSIVFQQPDLYCRKIRNEPEIILMNMIHIEQCQAWEAMKNFELSVFPNTISKLIITSGVLVEGREDYLHQCHLWNWVLEEEYEEEGWLGFVFRLK